MSDSASILYCGHSTVIVTTEAGKKVAIDPWLDGNPSCPAALHDPGHIDYILLTHGHSDHAGSVVSLAKKYGSIVYSNYELCELLVKDGIPAGQTVGMNKGGTAVIADANLKVSMTNAFHSSSYEASDGNRYYAGEAAGMVLTLESGRTIYHAGDTCLFKDMKLIKKQFEPEVVLVPIGDLFTMGPRDAAKAVDWLEPKAVIPIHHSTFELLTGTPEEFVASLDPGNIKPVVLEPGGDYSF